MKKSTLNQHINNQDYKADKQKYFSNSITQKLRFCKNYQKCWEFNTIISKKCYSC